MGKIYSEINQNKMDQISDEILALLSSMEGTEDAAEFETKGKEKVLAFIREKINEEHKRKAASGKAWDFSGEKALPVFAEEDSLSLVPMKEEDRDFYLSIRKQYWELGSEEESREWEKLQRAESFYCRILLSGEPCGYIGLKDTSKNLWELAVELDREHCYRGLGGKAVMLFLQKVKELTGKTQFQALVESDNQASQKCFEKMGAKLIDIYLEAFSDDDEAAAFEEKHLDMITPEMVELAERLEVEPRELLSHVLDYRIILEKEMTR